MRGFARGSFGRQSSSFGRTGREQNGNQGPLENTTPLYGGRGGGLSASGLLFLVSFTFQRAWSRTCVS